MEVELCLIMVHTDIFFSFFPVMIQTFKGQFHSIQQLLFKKYFIPGLYIVKATGLNINSCPLARGN